MKKNYTILLTLLIACMRLSAQPVLNASDFTSFYLSNGYSANDVAGLSPGNVGANQIWDFSSLLVTLDGTFSIVPIVSTPYASSFPTANFVIKSTNVGIPDPYYSYYKSSPTTIETVGGADSKGANLENDHSTLFQFPYAYNTLINDTYQSLGDIFISSFTSTYDAYGTLITPYGTYTNVIRQKRVEIDGAYTYTDYIWCTTNPFKYIMGMGFRADGTDSYNYVSIFSNFSNLSVAKISNENLITTYPNPTTSILNLQFSNAVTIDKLVIIDITGRIVLRQTEKVTQINVEKLVKGVYLIEAYSGNEKYQTKFIKE